MSRVNAIRQKYKYEQPKYKKGDRIEVYLTPKINTKKTEIGYVKWAGFGSFKAYKTTKFKEGIWYRVELTEKNRGKKIFIQIDRIVGGNKKAVPSKVVSTKSPKKSGNKKNKINIDKAIERKQFIRKDLIQLYFVGLRSNDDDSKDNIKGIDKVSIKIYVDVYTYTLKELKKEILRTQYNIPNKSDILLIYNNMILNDDKRSLNYYGIENQCSILICVSETPRDNDEKKDDSKEQKSNGNRGRNNRNNGVNVRRQIRQTQREIDKQQKLKKKRELQKKKLSEQKKKNEHKNSEEQKIKLSDMGLPEMIGRSESEVQVQLLVQRNKFEILKKQSLDILTFERSNNCITMPCGHGIPVDSLLAYAEAEFNAGKKELRCPRIVGDGNSACNKIWNFNIIRKILISHSSTKSPNQWIESLDGFLIFGFIRSNGLNHLLKYPYYILNIVYHFFAEHNMFLSQQSINANNDESNDSNWKNLPFMKYQTKYIKKKQNRKSGPILLTNKTIDDYYNENSFIEPPSLPKQISSKIVTSKVDIASKLDLDDSKESKITEAKDDYNDFVIKLNDIINLELLCARNTFKDLYDFQKCSECNTVIYRKKVKLSQLECYAKCPLCVDHKFCWVCCHEWRNTNNKYCENNECALSAIQQNLNILKTCDRKTIGRIQNIPNTRACINCSQLICHTEACKHMQCYYCKVRFCFSCLKPYDTVHNRWQCGSHSDPCPVAPRQGLTTLPTPNIVSVTLF